MILVLMPISPDRIIPEPVMSSILMQGIPVTIIMHNSIGDDAVAARQYLHDYPYKSDKFILTMDNDLVLPQDSLQKLVDFLNKNEDFGAIAISKLFTPTEPVDEAGHIDAAPVLFRLEVYEKIDYHNRNGCECMGMTKDIRNLGYKIGFLGGLKAKHILETSSEKYLEEKYHEKG